MAEQKTNVMRLLEKNGIRYSAKEYPHADAPLDGVTAATLIGENPAHVFKTLVARGASKRIYVFDIPVASELDLKKAAKAVGEKSVAMVHVGELNALTGYVRGGCSPIGMKKRYITVFHATAAELSTVIVSAGRIGTMVELAPADLVGLAGAAYADIITED